MSHPGMAPVVADVVERGDGVYDAPLQFTMAGDWILLVTGQLADGRGLKSESKSRACGPHPSEWTSSRLPLVGAFLRWRHARTAMQLVLLLVAAAVVLHGLLGPQLAPRNLATVLTSIHWRGLLIVAIAVVGNLFCTACPMVLARDVGRRFVHPAWRWPRRLRGKWLGLALLVLVLFCVRAVRSLGACRAPPRGWSRLLRSRDRRRRALLRRVVLQAPVPHRPVQLHGLGDVPHRAARRRSRDVQVVPDVGLHQGKCDSSAGASWDSSSR